MLKGEGDHPGGERFYFHVCTDSENMRKKHALFLLVLLQGIVHILVQQVFIGSV